MHLSARSRYTYFLGQWAVREGEKKNRFHSDVSITSLSADCDGLSVFSFSPRLIYALLVDVFPFLFFLSDIGKLLPCRSNLHWDCFCSGCTFPLHSTARVLDALLWTLLDLLLLLALFVFYSVWVTVTTIKSFSKCSFLVDVQSSTFKSWQFECPVRMRVRVCFIILWIANFIWLCCNVRNLLMWFFFFFLWFKEGDKSLIKKI